MSTDLYGFRVNLFFDRDGDIDDVFYEDSQGCGYVTPVSLDSTVRDLVEAHLSHYSRSHNMEPESLCTAQAFFDGGHIFCCLPRDHSEGHHEFRG